MRAVEFESTVSAAGEIALPPDIASSIPAGEHLRVVVMWDAPEQPELDAAWRASGRERFEAAYAPEDSVYEQLADEASPGDVFLIGMQFHQQAGAKIRPAVVLLDTGDNDFVAAPITPQFQSSGFDLEIAEWRAVGMNAASFIRIHKLTVLPKGDAIRMIGRITGKDRISATRLCRVLPLIDLAPPPMPRQDTLPSWCCSNFSTFRSATAE